MYTTISKNRIKRKRERKRKKTEEIACETRVRPQKLDLLHCQSKLNRISHASAQGAEIHSVAWKREKEIEKGRGCGRE